MRIGNACWIRCAMPRASIVATQLVKRRERLQRPALPPETQGDREFVPTCIWGRMKNLKIWQKLALLAAIFTIPFLAVTWQLVSMVDSQGVSFARQERDGLKTVLPLLRVAQDQSTLTALLPRMI